MAFSLGPPGIIDLTCSESGRALTMDDFSVVMGDEELFGDLNDVFAADAEEHQQPPVAEPPSDNPASRALARSHGALPVVPDGAQYRQMSARKREVGGNSFSNGTNFWHSSLHCLVSLLPHTGQHITDELCTKQAVCPW